MNTPAKEPFVVPSTKKRDTLIAVVVGLVILLFVGYGVMYMSRPGVGNRLTGTIIKKSFTPQREQQVAFSGRKIEGTREIAGEFVLQVRVDAENRNFDVPVEQAVFEAKQIGDSLTFIRPPSEQR